MGQFISSMAHRLKHGIPDEDLRSPFDRRSFFAYTLLILAAALGFAAYYLSGFSISLENAPRSTIWAPILICSGWLLRRYGHSDGAGACEGIALFYVQGALLMFGLLYLTSISGPFADHMLARADAALGFDWKAFAEMPRHSPAALTLISRTYNQISWQPPVIIMVLFLGGNSERGWILITAWVIASILTALIYPFFPAVGAFQHYGISHTEYPFLNDATPWKMGWVIHQIRDNGVRAITPDLFVGLVSFPSFHAVTGTLFAWAAFANRWLRWPMLLLNAAMIVSALIVGSHYLADLIGGAAVAGVAVLAAKRLLRTLHAREQVPELSPVTA